LNFSTNGINDRARLTESKWLISIDVDSRVGSCFGY